MRSDSGRICGIIHFIILKTTDEKILMTMMEDTKDRRVDSEDAE